MAVNTFKEDEQQREMTKKETIVRMLSYLLGYKKQIIAVLLIMAATIGITTCNPLIIERAINVHIANMDMEGLLKLGGFAVILNVFFLIGVKLRMFIMAKVTNQIVYDIRNELYEHIQTLSFQFFDSRPTGKILARIMGDVNALKDVLSDSITNLIPELFTIIVVTVIMFVKSVRLALAAVIMLPVLVVGMYIIQNASHKRWQIHRKKSSNLTAFIHEDISGIRVIQSFTAEQETNDSFDELVKEHRESFVKAVQISDCFGSLIELTWGMGSFLLYFIGIKIMGVGTIEIGTFMAFSSYLSMFWSPIRNLANFYNKMVTNLSAAERIFDILDTKPDIVDKEDVYEMPEIKGAVEFSDVSFAYADAPEKKILKHVNFHIKPGETVALVGPTGAGKTTIVNLLSRFYDVTKGQIFVDGNDISKVSIHSLRSQMGVMTQDNFLFTGTIRDNIRYGNLNATEEEIVAAAKAVNAHEFIMKLEKGYDTEVKERGVGLSNGQRQLLAFARTMVAKPAILILDEATSSIDTHTEILVQQGIEELLKGRTSFVIAHRLSTIKNADHIFVIDDGQICERGTHQELLEKKGMYYELYQAQFRTVTAPL